MSAPVYAVLLHYPVVNRHGEVVTTSVTNLDVHDISRSARTYGIQKLYFVTPIEDQHGLIGRILHHWKRDSSRNWHADRVEAISVLTLRRSFEEVKKEIQEKHGEPPEVVLTDARPHRESVSYQALKEELKESTRTRPLVIVFGTGWGVAETFYPEVDRILAPVYGSEGRGGYNHLSVRAAAAVIFDRLLGQ